MHLRKEIRDAKLALQIAEARHGHGSAERKVAVELFWDLQKQLGALELQELGITK